MESIIDDLGLEKATKEEFCSMAKLLRSLFSSVEGQKVFDFLKRRYCDSFFDTNHPSERALFQQGQVSVINDIQTIIDNVNKGLL